MPIVSTSTSAFYERARQDMGALRSRTEQIQSQIGSGERLARSSDDPVAASRLRGLSRSDRLAGIDMAGANRATADLTLADSALSDFADAIGRAKVLATQAASGTLTASQRASIGEELQAIHGNLLSLANTRDSGGHALFGGESPGDAYTLNAAGDAVYVGTAGAGTLPLGDGQSVTRSLTGPEFLSFAAGNSSTDLMATVKSLADALRGGAADPADAARGTLDALSTSLDAVTTAQTVVGTRLSWIDLTTEQRTTRGELRASEQAEIGGTDTAGAVARLQEMLVVLEASQASFAKLAGLSLFDQLR